MNMFLLLFKKDYKIESVKYCNKEYSIIIIIITFI